MIVSADSQWHWKPSERLTWRRAGIATARLIGALLAITVTASLIQVPFHQMGFKLTAAAQHPLMSLMVALMIGITALCTLAVFIRWTEGKWPYLLSGRRAVQEMAMGIVLGCLLSATSVTLLWVLGAYHVVSVAAPAVWGATLLSALPIAIASSVVEEALVRGVFMRQLASIFSPGIALLVSAVVFGLVHLANPGATVAVALGLAVQAGLLLGCAYLLTRRLWAAISIHFAWNFMQAGVVGGALSGNGVNAIITAEPRGAIWLSGGAFGIEGSVLTTFVCAAAACALMLVGLRSGRARLAADPRNNEPPS